MIEYPFIPTTGMETWERGNCNVRVAQHDPANGNCLIEALFDPINETVNIIDHVDHSGINLTFEQLIDLAEKAKESMNAYVRSGCV